MQPYLEEIRKTTRGRNTRKELRKYYFLHTGKEVPKDANIRDFVSKYHSHQQAINGGLQPSKFWLRHSG
jgi:hypothetical protein